MKLTDNTVLITGGSSGIGLEIAKFFHFAGNKVIICSTDDAKIDVVRKSFPGIIGLTADLSQAKERVRLFSWIEEHHNNTNILVNNAGIQLRGPITEDNHPWSAHAKEIAINLEAPMHLCSLFTPFLRNKTSTIINISSGLVLTPVRFAPVYCASKAGIHAYTRILRKELEQLSIEVMEIMPPAVDTQLGGEGVHAGTVDATLFVRSVMERLIAGENEVGYGSSEESRLASQAELQARFDLLNA